MFRLRLVPPLALIFWATSAGMGASSSAATPDTGSPWLMGYVVGYERDLLPLAELDWFALTHVAVGRVTPRADGTLNTTFDIDPVGGPAWARAVVRQAHAHHVKALLMVGGQGEQAGFVGAASAPRQGRFVRNLLAIVRSYGFDGLDLDWEPLSRADEAPLKALALSLKRQQLGLLLTLPVNFVNANDPTAEARPSLAALSGTFDRVNIMTYGMAGVYDGWQSWHSSALTGASDTTPSSVQSSVQAYLKAGVPAGKLGLGIGFYGLCYQGVTAPAQRAVGMKIVADDGEMSYVNIMSRYFNPAARRWDTRAGAPYLSSATPLGRQRCTYLSYEDARSIALKGQYARRLGLGGAVIWTLAQGHFQGRPAGRADPLLTAAHAAFRP